MYFLNTGMRDEFNKVIEWYIGQKNNYSVSAGKYGKYFESYLDARQFDMVRMSYANGDYDDIWRALFVMCDLFRELAVEVAEYNKFEYPTMDDKSMAYYLKHTVWKINKKLPLC